MNWQKWLREVKWPQVLSWALVLLLFLGGARKLYQLHANEGPAMASLESLPGVEQAVLEEGELCLKLGAAADLKSVMAEAAKLAGELGVETTKLEDERSEKLAAVWNQVSFSIAQAVSRGEYETMRPRWEKIACDAGVELKAFLDEGAFYLTLQDGQDYLYEVIPRANQGEGV